LPLYIPDPENLAPAADLIEELGAELAARYAGAEDELIREIAKRSYRDVALQQALATATLTAEQTQALADRIAQNRAFAELAAYRAQSIRELQFLAIEVTDKLRRAGLAQELIDIAAKEGEAAAAARLRMASRLPQTSALTGNATQAVAALTIDLSSRLEAMHLRISRYPQDAYQKVISFTASSQMLTGQTMKVAQAQAVQQFLSQGITGFVDRADRNWRIGSYAEMAGRTAVRRAYEDAGIWRMQQSGLNLVTIVGGIDACKLCAPWIGKVLSTNGQTGVVTLPHATEDRQIVVQIAGTLDQAKAAGWGHPNCFPGFVPVSAPSGVVGADSRWFEGEVIVIDTAAGRQLTVTPNHPILTQEGWVAAGSLVEGQNLLSYNGNVEQVGLGRPDHEGVETPIGEVFETLRKSSHVTSVTMPGSAEDFHGDGIADSDVHVVFADRLLKANGESEGFNLSSEGTFLVSSVGKFPLLADGALGQVVHRALSATDGVVGGSGPFRALLGGGCVHSALHGLAGGDLHTSTLEPVLDTASIDTDYFTDLLVGDPFSGVEPDGFGQPVGIDPALLDSDIVFLESPVDQLTVDVDGGRYLADSLTGLVSADCIVKVERRGFAGHVYNLQSGDGWYTADSIVVHNCRDRAVAYLPGLSIPQESVEYSPEREKERSKQREIERDIRAAKRDAATAGDDVSRRRATREVRERQASMRQFINDTGRNRSNYREQLHFADGR